MTKVFAACAMAAALTMAGAAQANEKLAQASGCTTCHGVDKKVIGPSFKEIAAKYRISAIPQIMLFKGSEQPVERPSPGVKSEADIVKMINRVLGS